jgi:hypothetical protein
VDDIAYRRATARIEAIFAFYRHVLVYLVVCFFLAAVNLFRNPHHLWFLWVTFGWGIGLLVHGLNVYSYRWFGGRRDQMIQRELKRQRESEETPAA